jgi:hypothetical protein
MNKERGKFILLLLLTLLLTGTLTLSFSGSISELMITEPNGNYSDPVTIDFITIKSLVKAVSVKQIPVKSYIEEIDSLSRTWDIKKVRNPFIKRPIDKHRSATREKSTSKTKVKRKHARIIVNGIVMDKSKPYAILNGEIYGVGDQIKGYTVQAIEDSLVVLYHSNHTHTVKFHRE